MHSNMLPSQLGDELGGERDDEGVGDDGDLAQRLHDAEPDADVAHALRHGAAVVDLENGEGRKGKVKNRSKWGKTKPPFSPSRPPLFFLSLFPEASLRRA